MKVAATMLDRCCMTKPRAAVLAAALALIAASTAAAAQSAATPAQPTAEDLMAEGASIYRNQCARCHGDNGEGQRQGHDAAPRLAGNFARLSVGEIAVQVLRGGSYMPPFQSLSDREIAAVTSYVRNSFGNSLGGATEQDVAEYRQ